MGINPFRPVHVGNGYWKMKRKEPTPAETNAFIVKVMNKIINDEGVILKAEPPRNPRDVFQHTDMMTGENKIFGFTCALDIATQKVLISLKYKDYVKTHTPNKSDDQIYMAIRADVEKLVDLFTDLEISK